VHKFKLIIYIYNLGNLALVFLALWRVVSPKDSPPVCRGVHSIEADSACVLEKTGNEKHAYFFIKVGGRGRKIKLFKHVFALGLYSLPIVFSKIFSLATLARLCFILHLQNANMRCALPTQFIYSLIV